MFGTVLFAFCYLSLGRERRGRLPSEHEYTHGIRTKSCTGSYRPLFSRYLCFYTAAGLYILSSSILFHEAPLPKSISIVNIRAFVARALLRLKK